MTEQETELTRRAMAGDRAALDDLWRRMRRWVGAVLLVHKPARPDLEDLLQDVALTLVRRISELRHPGAFRGWLRAAAVNAAVSAGRREQTRGGGERALPQVAVDEESRASARLSDVLERVRCLPIELREPLVLKALEGLRQRDVADILGISETTVETRLARARRRLREELGQRSEIST